MTDPSDRQPCLPGINITATAWSVAFKRRYFLRNKEFNKEDQELLYQLRTDSSWQTRSSRPVTCRRVRVMSYMIYSRISLQIDHSSRV